MMASGCDDVEPIFILSLQDMARLPEVAPYSM